MSAKNGPGTEGRIEGEWLTITQAENALGLSHGALSPWLKRHKLFHATRKRGKYRYISLTTLKRYETLTQRKNVERVQERPPGYVGVYKAADLLGASTSFVWAAVKRGEVYAVRVGYINYYRRSDLERLALVLKDVPLPGYEAIRDRCKRIGADRTACSDWLKNHGYGVRKFRAPDKQLTLYALKQDLDIWEARFRGHCRLLTFDQANAIRQRHAKGEPIPALSRCFGIQPGSVRQIVLNKTYNHPPQLHQTPQDCEQTFAGIARP